MSGVHVCGIVAAMTPEEEARHLAAAESELRREFPNVPAYAVHEALEIEHKAFDRAPVRDYVPLLVARTARHRLRHHIVA
jgi:hypothetical protein